MPTKRQYCRDSPNGAPAASTEAAPTAGSHPGSRATLPGSAIHRASGTAAAVRMPSSTTLTAIRRSERPGMAVL